MVSLEHLGLGRNQVSGPIPIELGRLGSLRRLGLGDNQIEGPIPATLGNLTSLEFLRLQKNRMTGTIPRELDNLSNLEELILFSNALSGAIPGELGNLKKLEILSLSRNQLTGAIPLGLAGLSAVKQMDLGSNNLSGPIPPELAALSSLTTLRLSDNNLSGPLPPEFGDLESLEKLGLVYNPDLRGFLPRSLMNIGSLSSLLAYGTGLCAPIDDEFRAWLSQIDARLNDCDVERVERLALSEFFAATGGDSWTRSRGWNTSAGVDSWHGVTMRGGRVSGIALADNGLAGTVPPGVENLTALETLDLGGNNLGGEFPVAFSAMADLTSIRFSGNERMEGPLPFRLTELTRLEALEYEDTGLCASPAMTFQDWLGRIDVVAGATCGNPDEVGLSLPVVYLTQAIQRPAGDVPLIAGRDALLRVFLTSDAPFSFYEPEVVATFTRAGQEVHRVTMKREGDLLAVAVDESDLRNSFNAVIPAEHIQPDVELVVEADPGRVVPRAAGSEVRFPGLGRHTAERDRSAPHGVDDRTGSRGGGTRLIDLRMDRQHRRRQSGGGSVALCLPLLGVPRAESGDLRHIAKPGERNRTVGAAPRARSGPRARARLRPLVRCGGQCERVCARARHHGRLGEHGQGLEWGAHTRSGAQSQPCPCALRGRPRHRSELPPSERTHRRLGI